MLRLSCLFPVMVALACSPEKGDEASSGPSAAPPARVSTRAGAEAAYSNILREDYVGPQTCGECHAENYASWKQHPHSRMNMLASKETVLGDFSGTSLSYNGLRAVFRKEGGVFVAEYFEGEKRVRRFRITRVIGWRYEQDYVGVQVEGPEPPSDRLYRDETRLRFSYSLVRKQWLPQSYLEPTEYAGSEYLARGELRYDPFAPDRLPFNERCAPCHNTYPYALRLYKIHTRDGMFSGFPPGPGVEPQVVEALARAQGDLGLMEQEGISTDRFVSVGISCESCHFGGREHAAESREIRFVPTHPLLAGWTPDPLNARKNPRVVNAICRQCHHSGASAKDNWPDGSASVNSMESIEMDRGACQGELRCTHCHNTHIGGPRAGAPDRQEHLDACLSCHEEYRGEAAAQTHSRHDSGQVSCLDCHMPRIVQGFAAYNRTHRIASPGEPEILATGMPNACNLCHLDKSLAWTRDALAQGWGRRVELPPVLQAQFGRAFERPAGQAWLDHPFSLVRTVAAGAYARSPRGREALPELLEALDEPNAYARLRFLESVETLLGRPLSAEEYSLTGSPEQRGEQVQNLRRRYATPH